MKRIYQIILLFLAAISVYGQTLNGRFEGAITRDGSIQLVNFDFYHENGIQKGTYDIPEIGYYDVPVKDIKILNDTLNISFYYGNFLCLMNESKKEITGINQQWNPSLRLHLKNSEGKERPFLKTDILFNNGEVKLSGMLYTPKNGFKGIEKYIILIHGSGAQDRYAPYYISLGHSLAEQGFGVVLYDKRGTGQSSGNFETASMEDLANDAVAAYTYIKNLKGGDSIEVGFLGTSQGGWVAPLAANKVKNCDFLVLNVSPAVSVFEQDINRVEYSMKADGWKQEDIDAALTYSQLYFQYTRDTIDSSWSKLEQMIVDVKNKKWADYIHIPQNKKDFVWWRNNNYNPESTLTNLNCRTLVLFGEYDPLVPPAENTNPMTNFLSKAGIQYEIKIIPSVGHDMLTFQGLNGENWNWPNVYWQWRYQPKAFISTINNFISKK